ncbi:MAG: hypothetical protein WCA20_23160 [Candidatus Sulfotelmatobacter sp.]
MKAIAEIPLPKRSKYEIPGLLLAHSREASLAAIPCSFTDTLL